MQIIYNNVEFMGSSELFSDYVSNPEKTGELYTSHYKDDLSWERILDKASSADRNYAKIAEILRRQNTAFGSDQAAMDNIERFEKNRAFAVVTGQQVGILTGPLYTIYKAITAVKLALHLRKKYNSEFTPIFWVESNDHDMEEANHINLLDSEDELMKLEYFPENYVLGCSMKDVPVDGKFSDLVDDLASQFPDTEFKEGIFDIIRESYAESTNLEIGFGRMLARLLSMYGLVLFSPSDPEVKRLMTPIFEANVESPLESMEIVNSAGDRAREMGYEAMIEKSQDSTCMFMGEGGVRRKLFFRDNRFLVDGIDETMETGELLECLKSEPWRFSPNVALRPVIQDYLLPTAAYVAGPGEISYFAQLGELYSLFNVNMPIIYPRASLTVVESKVERVMDKNDLDLEDLTENYESLFSRVSRRSSGEKLAQILDSSKEKFESIFRELRDGLSEFDPGLKNVVESTQRKVDHQINVLEERAFKAQRSRDDILRGQIKRACMNIYPDGKPQERVFNIVQYLVYYSLQFLEDIMSEIELA